MSPDGIAWWPNLGGDSRAKDPAYPPRNRVSEAVIRPRNLLCHPRIILLAVPRIFQQAPVERRTMDAVAGCSRSSLPAAAPALHHASTPAAAG